MEGNDIQLSSYALDMASIFERYLLNSIRNNRVEFPADTTILDGNKEGQKKFYNQPSLGRGEAKPDYIIKVGEICKIIADAKYKPKSNDADRYQVISHALSFDAKIAVLVLPKREDNEGDRLVRIGAVGLVHEIAVYEYYFNLAADDLLEEEKMLAVALNSLCY